MDPLRRYADKRQARKALLAFRAAAMAQGVGDRVAEQLDLVLNGRIDVPARAAHAISRTRTAGIYWPLNHEPDLRDVFCRWAFRTGKRLALPFALPGRVMNYRLWTPSEAAMPDHAGIPSATGACVVPELIVAPMLGASLSGRRLGYGGGYFDRFMAAARAKASPVFFLGIVLEGAFLEESLFNELDLPFDALLTERRLREPSSGSR